jgi:hypothetical protein
VHDQGNLGILLFSVEMAHEGFSGDQGLVIFAALGKSIGLDLKVGFDALQSRLDLSGVSMDNGATVRLLEEIDDGNRSDSQRQSQDRLPESAQGEEGDDKVEV